MKTLMELPVRVRGKYTQTLPKQKMITNHFRVRLDLDASVYIYCVKFNPYIHAGNRQKFRQLAELMKHGLQPKIGKFVMNGMNIFALKSMDEKVTVEVIDNESKTYSVTVLQVKKIVLKDLESSDHKKQQGPLMFLNNLFKSYLRQLKFTEIGRTRKYFDTTRCDKVTSYKIYNGFECSISMLEGGPFLRVDTCSKLVGGQSCLEIINSIYKVNSSRTKDEKRATVYEHFHNRMAMANYGQGRCWIIQEVIYDVDMCTYTIEGSKQNETLAAYYANKYNLKAQNPKQPLFKARPSRKGQVTITYLIPEFMLLTTSMADLDEKVRAEISKHTIKSPEDKLFLIQNLLKKVQKEVVSGGINEMKEELGIDIDTETLTYQTKKLPPPKLSLGQNISVDERKINSFPLFDKPIYENKHSVDMKIITFSFNPQAMIKLFSETCSKLKIAFSYSHKSLGHNVDIRAVDLITQQIQKCNKAICLVVLPSKLKNSYSRLKTYALMEMGCLTQFALESTLERKGFNSIVTKILLQMIHKLGNSLWLVNPPKLDPCNAHPMILSVDASNCKAMKGSQILSVVSSMNPKFSKFNYDYKVQDKSQISLGSMLEDYISRAMHCYKDANGETPTDLIVLRDGLSEQQADVVMKTELDNLLNYLKKLPNRPKLIYISLERKASERFFSSVGGRIVNAPSGTFIHETIVSKNYDFYLIGQQCNRGTVTPTRFRVLYNDSTMEEGRLAHLIYSQCFNFQNWSGSVRLPAPSLYAKKLSTFVSTHILTTDPTQKIQKLNNHPYFI